MSSSASPPTPPALAPGLGHIAGGTFSLDPNLNWHADSSAFVTRCIPFTRLFRDPAVEREYIRCRSSQGKTAASALLIGVSSIIVLSILLYPPPDAENDVILGIILAICAYMFGAGVVEYLICGRKVPGSVAEDHVLATRHRWAQRLAWLVPTQVLVTVLRLRSNPVCGPVAPRFSDLHYQCLRSFRSVYSVCGLFSAIMVRDPDWATGGLVLQTLSEFTVLIRDDITAADFVFRFLLAAPFAWMMAFQNAVRDRSDRIAFAKHIMLHIGRTELLAQRTMLEAVVEAAIPPILLKRLMALQPATAAGTLPLHELGDASPRALVVATSAVGFGVFATSKLLDRTVSSLHSLFSFFDAALEAFGLEHGAVHGDTFVATAGLLQRSRHRRPADLANAVLCFAWWQVHSSLPVDCELHSAVCAGPLTGSVCGSHRLRYVASGPALEAALSGLSSAPAGEVWAHCDVFRGWSNEEIAASPFATSTPPSTVASAVATSWRIMTTDRIPVEPSLSAYVESTDGSSSSSDEGDTGGLVPPTLRLGAAATATEDDDAEELPLIQSPNTTLATGRGAAASSASLRQAAAQRSPDGGDTDRPSPTAATTESPTALTVVQFGLGMGDSPEAAAQSAAASASGGDGAGPRSPPHGRVPDSQIDFPRLVPDPHKSSAQSDGGEAADSTQPAHAAADDGGSVVVLPRIHRPEHAMAALVGSLKLAAARLTSPPQLPRDRPLVSNVTAGNSSITSDGGVDDVSVDPIAAADAMARASHVAPTDGRDLRTISRVDFWTGEFTDADDEVAYQRYRERRLDTLLGTLIASQAIVWITLGIVGAVERLTSPEVSYSDAGWHDVIAFGLLLVAFVVDCFIAIRHLRIVKYSANAATRDPATRSRDVRVNQGILVTTSIIGTLGLLALRRSVVTNHIEYLQMLMFGLNASSLATLRWWVHLPVTMGLALFYLIPVQYHQAYIPWPVVLLQLLLVAWGSPTAAYTDRIRAGIGLTLDMQTKVVRANSRLLAAFADRLVPASNVDAALGALREATDQRTHMGWKRAGIEDRFKFLLRRPLTVGFKESIADFVCMEVRLRQPAAAAVIRNDSSDGVSDAVASWADSATAMTRSPRSRQQQQQPTVPSGGSQALAATGDQRKPGTDGWESAKQLAAKWGQIESVIDSASGQHLHLLSTLGDTFTVGGPFTRSDAAERCAAEACVRLLTSLLALLPSAGFTAAGVIEESMAALVGEARLRYRVYGVAPLHCGALAEEGAAVQQRLHRTPVRMAFVSRRFAGQAGALVGQLSRPHLVPAAPPAPGSTSPQQQYMAPPCLIPLAPQRWRLRTTGVTTVFPLLFPQPTPPTPMSAPL